MKKNILFEKNEKEEYLEQAKTRGFKIYNYTLGFICAKRKCSEIKYEDIVSLMKYDKRLKYNLYIFILTFEEWLRSKLFEETTYAKKEFKKSTDPLDTTSLEEIMKNQKNIL